MRLIKESTAAWTRGLPVVLSELLDGLATSYKIVPDGPDWDFRYSNQEFFDDRVMELLSFLTEDHGPSTIEGVIVGAGYSPHTQYKIEPEYFLTGISCEDGYLDHDIFVNYTTMFRFRTPPVYLIGSYTQCLPDQFCTGQSALTPDSGQRFGVVFKPVLETYSEVLGSRLIGCAYNPFYKDG